MGKRTPQKMARRLPALFGSLGDLMYSPDGILLAAASISPADFARWATWNTGRRFEIPKHVAAINSALMEIDAGTLKGLVICVPPRHGKSELCSRWLPAWYLCRHPDKNVILCSYSEKSAVSFGRESRLIAERWGRELFGACVRDGTYSSSDWQVRKTGGSVHATGIDGQLTGRGAHLFICDDLVKGPEMAMSRHQRELAWEKFMTVVETRLEPGGAVVIVQTRWHPEDPAGMAIAQIGAGLRKDWKALIFPAIAEEHDEFGRVPGEALWPERYSAEYLADLRARWDHEEAKLGAYWWDCLYQQRASPPEGGYFKRSWFKRWRRRDNLIELLDEDGFVSSSWDKAQCWSMLSLDLAYTKKESSDFFVCATLLVTPENDLLLDGIMRKKVDGPEQEQLIRSQYQVVKPYIVIVECVQAQVDLSQRLELSGIPVKRFNRRQDKVATARTLQALMSAGKFRTPVSADWLSCFEDEAVCFPNGKNDDQVDAVAAAAIEAASTVRVEVL